jgi:hypothetical protein
MRALTIILGLALTASFLFSGCAQRQTYVAPKGEVTLPEQGVETDRQSTDTDKPAELELEAVQVEDLQIELGGKSIKLANFNGSMKLNKGVSEAELKIPFYPIAIVGEDMALSGKINGKPGTVKQVTLTTLDSAEEVKAFYLKQYPKAMSVKKNDAGNEITGLVIENGKEQRYINITRKASADNTEIELQYKTCK